MPHVPHVRHISARFASLPLASPSLRLADAAIAEAAARLKIRQVLTLDADFHIDLGRSGKPLVNLLRSV